MSNIKLTFIKGGVTFLGEGGKQKLARLTRPCEELGIREIPAACNAYQSRIEVSSYNLYLKNPKGTDHLEDRRAHKPSYTEGRNGE